MTALGSDFEGALDRVLAMRLDPVMSPDLARRIVVRTTHLPQIERSGPSIRPAVPLPARQTRARRLARAGVPWGGAIAASLLLVLAGQGARDLPVADPVSSAGSIAMADSVGPTKTAPAPGEPLPEMATRTTEASAPASLPLPSRDRTPAPALADGHETRAPMPVQEGDAIEMAVAYPALPRERSAESEFTLAGNAVPAEPVYGPVLEEEPLTAHSRLTTPSSSAIGVAVAPAAAPRAGGPGRAGPP